MAVHLNVGDCVLVKTTSNDDADDEKTNKQSIGLIKYIGAIHGEPMKHYIGIELVEPIKNGHNGTIDGYTYFATSKGHGIHVGVNRIIDKLSVVDMFNKLKDTLACVTSKNKGVRSTPSYKPKSRRTSHVLAPITPISPSTTSTIVTSETMVTVNPFNIKKYALQHSNSSLFEDKSIESVSEYEEDSDVDSNSTYSSSPSYSTDDDNTVKPIAIKPIATLQIDYPHKASNHLFVDRSCPIYSQSMSPRPAYTPSYSTPVPLNFMYQFEAPNMMHQISSRSINSLHSQQQHQTYNSNDFGQMQGFVISTPYMVDDINR